jgi:hypothetical protein
MNKTRKQMIRYLNNNNIDTLENLQSLSDSLLKENYIFVKKEIEKEKRKKSLWDFEKISNRTIKVSKDYFADYALLLDNKNIAYDFPERVPKYVKKMVINFFGEIDYV